MTRHVTRVEGSKGNSAIGGDKQAAIKRQLLASNYGVFTVSPIQLIDIFTSFVNNIECLEFFDLKHICQKLSIHFVATYNTMIRRKCKYFSYIISFLCSFLLGYNFLLFNWNITSYDSIPFVRVTLLQRIIRWFVESVNCKYFSYIISFLCSSKLKYHLIRFDLIDFDENISWKRSIIFPLQKYYTVFVSGQRISCGSNLIICLQNNRSIGSLDRDSCSYTYIIHTHTAHRQNETASHRDRIHRTSKAKKLRIDDLRQKRKRNEADNYREVIFLTRNLSLGIKSDINDQPISWLID